MASTAPIPTKVPQTYAELRHCVEGAFLRGQREIEQAKVRTYWETGWFIHEHLLFNAGRADYGAQVIPRLARDLNIANAPSTPAFTSWSISRFRACARN